MKSKSLTDVIASRLMYLEVSACQAALTVNPSETNVNLLIEAQRKRKQLVDDLRESFYIVGQPQNDTTPSDHPPQSLSYDPSPS